MVLCSANVLITHSDEVLMTVLEFVVEDTRRGPGRVWNKGVDVESVLVRLMSVEAIERLK